MGIFEDTLLRIWCVFVFSCTGEIGGFHRSLWKRYFFDLQRLFFFFPGNRKSAVRTFLVYGGKHFKFGSQFHLPHPHSATEKVKHGRAGRLAGGGAKGFLRIENRPTLVFLEIENRPTRLFLFFWKWKESMLSSQASFICPTHILQLRR